VRLTTNRRGTPTTRIIRLSLDGRGFPYQAGQAAWLGLESHAELTPYSIASSPDETARHGWLEFLVKTDEARRFGAEVASIRRGTTVLMDGPIGEFTFSDQPTYPQYLFVAGGTGIAPIRSMIQHAVASGAGGRLVLLYSARRPEEFAYLSEMRGLARRGALTLELTLTGQADLWRHGRGRADATHMKRLIGDTPTMCYLCGPASMVSDLSVALHNVGVPTGQVKTEQW